MITEKVIESMILLLKSMNMEYPSAKVASLWSIMATVKVVLELNGVALMFVTRLNVLFLIALNQIMEELFILSQNGTSVSLLPLHVVLKSGKIQ